MELELYHRRMEVELRNFIIIWIIVLISLCYCYAIAKRIHEGIKRLVFVLPVVLLFAFLPFDLYSFHLNFLTFFSIAWLANSKLLLFCFGKGPLTSDPSMSLAAFIAVASLPIKLQKQEHYHHPSPKNPKIVTPLIYAVKGLVLAIGIYIITNYKKYNHPIILLCSTTLHFYLLYELTLTLVSTLVEAMIGVNLEPTFNEPYLSTSLQNFWGRRWNLMATNILRLTVHQPMKKKFTHVLGHRWATPTAVVVTFLASGAIHELMFYHLLRVKPTGEATCFFLLHGTCVAVEIEVKKMLWLKKYWRLPWLVSVCLTLGFVMVTASWLLFAPLRRYSDYVRVLDEYGAVATFWKNAKPQFGFVNFRPSFYY